VICILIPALNEEAGLRALLPSIPRRLLGMPISVVVVSDGSTDGTHRVVEANAAVLVDLPANQGKGAALRAGLAYAAQLQFEHLITMDGDGQHAAADLERLLAPVAAGICDASFGSRYMQDARCGTTPWNRFLVRRAMVKYLHRRLGTTFTDPFCGYRCFTRAALEHIHFDGDGYHSELEAIFDAVINQLTVVDVPIRRIYGPATSKMGAGGSAFRGRVRVLGQYLEVVTRKSRELRQGRREVTADVGLRERSV
jgi:glycosyltransferase involved in cell wall biosynthesis